MRFSIVIAIVLAFPGVLIAQNSPSAPHARPAAGSRGPAIPATYWSDRAVAAIDAGNLATLGDELDRQIKAAVTDPKSFDVAAVTRMAAFRQFVSIFGATADFSSQQKVTLKWLATHQRLLYTVMSAVNSQKPPADLLDRLAAFYADSPAKCENYPDLVAALLVVPNRQPYPQIRVVKPDDSQPKLLFDYFTDPRAPLQISVKDLPWQLAVYVVDIKLAAAEIKWATDHYAARQQIGTIYFEVPYDTQSYLRGIPRQIESQPYTLPNLQHYGGVCIDQAYYATQIAKVMGIPAAICTGQGGAGQASHAWVGYMQINNRRAKWNFSEGRYQEDLFWSANIDDPQTQESLTDADVGLLAELQNVTPDARLQSTLLLKQADLVDDANKFEFYKRVISLSPGNRLAWAALAQMTAKKKLTVAQTEQAGQVVSSYAVRNYPDFACAVLVRMSAEGTPDAQIQSLSQIARFFPDRPDLVARIRVMQGKLQQQNKKYNDALASFGDVLTKELNAGPIVLQAMQQVDAILREQNDMPRLAKIYNQVWSQLPAPDASAFATQSPYYTVGQAYALLLDEMGSKNEADAVRGRLAQLTGNSAPRR